MASPNDRDWVTSGKTYPTKMVTSVEKTSTSEPTYKDVSHDFMGGTQSFALYGGYDDGKLGSVKDNAYIMVNFQDPKHKDMFRRLLFSNSTLVNPFMTWLYDQCVYPEHEKHYLKVRHPDFA